VESDSYEKRKKEMLKLRGVNIPGEGLISELELIRKNVLKEKGRPLCPGKKSIILLYGKSEVER